MSAPDCPEWVLYARKFVALEDKGFLTKAIESCPDAAVRKFLSRPDLGQVPAHEREPLAERLASEGCDSESDLVQILGLFHLAKAAESPERLDRKAGEIALAICTRCVVTSRKHAFSECEAVFARTLGTGAAGIHKWYSAEELLTGATGIYRNLAQTEPDLYGKEVAWTLNNLGNVLRNERNFGEARKAFEEARDVYRKLAEEEPHIYLPYVATALNNLGNVLRDERNFGEARKALEEALTARRDLAEEEPHIYLPDIATALNNLGIVLRDERNFGEARKVFEEARDVYRTLAGEEPRIYLRYVATTLNNLGAVLSDERNFSEARKAFEEARDVYRKLAEEEPHIYLRYVAMTLNNLGAVLRDERNFAEARKAFEEACGVYRDLTEEDPHIYMPDIATALNNLGIVLRDERNFGEARKAFEEALAVRRDLAEGEPHIYLPDVATTLNNLGTMLRDEHKFGEARKVFEEALAIRRDLAEDEPNIYLPDVAMTLNNLGNVLRNERKFGEARKAFGEAFSKHRKLAEAQPHIYLPGVAMTLNNLGNVLSDERNFDEARKAFEEALAIRRKLAAEESHIYLPDVATTVNNLGIALSNERNFAEARKAFEEARDVYRRLAEEEPHIYLPDVAMALNNLGNVLTNERKFGEARKAFEEALDVYRELAEERPHIYLPYVATTLNNLGTVTEEYSRSTEPAVEASLEAVRCAEEGTSVRDLWLAKGHASGAYRRMLSHMAAIGDKTQAFRCLAAMMEGDVRATGTSHEEGFDATAQALLDVEKRLGRHIRIVLAQTLTRDGLFLGVLQSEEPCFTMTRADAFSAKATALFDEVQTLFNDKDKRGADERYQAVKRLGAAAWNALPEAIRAAFHPSNNYDVLISGDPYWAAFPWEALRYGDSDTSWLGFRMPLPRWGPITARGISRLAPQSIGDGNRTGFVICPWDAVRDKQLPGAEREAHEVVDRLRSLGYNVRDFVGSAATPGAMRIALGQAPSVLYFTGHGTLFGNEEALVLHDDLGAPSPSYFARREIGDLKVSSGRTDKLLGKGSLVVLSSCLTARTRDFGGQREDLAWALLEEGAEVVVGSPLPMHVSTGVMLGHWLFDKAFADSRGLAWTFARVRAYIEMHARMKNLPTWAAWALLSYHGNPYAQLPHMPKPIDLPADDGTLKTIADELGTSDLAEVAKLLGQIRG